MVYNATSVFLFFFFATLLFVCTDDHSLSKRFLRGSGSTFQSQYIAIKWTFAAPIYNVPVPNRLIAWPVVLLRPAFLRSAHQNYLNSTLTVLIYCFPTKLNYFKLPRVKHRAVCNDYLFLNDSFHPTIK